MSDLNTCIKGLAGKSDQPKKEEAKPSALVRIIQIKKGKK